MQQVLPEVVVTVKHVVAKQETGQPNYRTTTHTATLLLVESCLVLYMMDLLPRVVHDGPNRMITVNCIYTHANYTV